MTVPITYFRSSSYNGWDYCQQQFFINYILGVPQKANLKADKGTVTHKILECLAEIKQKFDTEDKDTILYTNDDIKAKIKINRSDFLKPTVLSKKDVEVINGTRINKQTYPVPCQLKPGHKRYGVELVEELITLVHNRYKDDRWKPVDLKDIRNWSWMALDFKNGLFDVRKRKIVESEKKFNIVIEKDWAKYKYKDREGNLAIKGTIDLITDIGDEILEIIDYKTGRRINWGSKNGKEIKTYKKLCEDFQLMMYYYAVIKLFPEAKHVVVTIFYIRDGGPFTITFNQDNLVEVEQKIQQRFYEIQSCKLPKMLDPFHNDFRCERLCDYYKNKSKDGHRNICDFIHDEIKLHGINSVIDNHSNPNFDVDNYNAPGE